MFIIVAVNDLFSLLLLQTYLFKTHIFMLLSLVYLFIDFQGELKWLRLNEILASVIFKPEGRFYVRSI